MMLSIDTYGPSEGARLLAKELGCRIIKKRNSRYRDSNRKVVINWGNTNRNWINTINRNENVRIASNKLSFFRSVSGAVLCPPWTTERAVVLEWINQGRTVVCRSVLSGSEGRGITIATSADELVEARLYTQYIPKRSEYRVHVVGGRVISVQRKVKKRDAPAGIDFKVRNTANGFVFQRNNINIPQDVKDQAIKAVAACGLDFGGVDVIWNERQAKAFVLEVNTAPGIEGTTVKEYAQALKELANAKLVR